MQFYESKPSEHVAGRAVVVPSGRCIGGGEQLICFDRRDVLN